MSTWRTRETRLHATNSWRFHSSPPVQSIRYTSRQHAHRRKIECKIRQIKYVISQKLSLGEIIMTCLHDENTWRLQKQGIATYFITSFVEHPFWATLPSSSNCTTRKCEIVLCLSSLTSITFPTSGCSADSGAECSLSFSISHN